MTCVAFHRVAHDQDRFISRHRPPPEPLIFQDRPELPGLGLGGGISSPIGGARPVRPQGALLAVEIDEFALIERTHGAQFADSVIRRVEAALSGVLGERDVVAHQGGARITAFLPGANRAVARARAEEVADEIRRSPMTLGASGRQLPLTLSIGVAVAPEHGATQAAMLAAAERARNRVVAMGGGGVEVALPPAEEPATPELRMRGFVGRSDQLRALVRLLEGTIQGRPALAIVHAEQGVGTSTLLRNLALEARVRGGQAVVGRAVPGDLRPPYEVWTQVIEKLIAVARVPRGDWSELPNLVPGAGSRFPLDSAMGPGSGSQYRLLEELTECIAQASSRQPLTIVLESMQWADSVSWDALEHVLTQLREVPVFIVVALADNRLPPDARERRATLVRRDDVTELAVPRLTRDEVKRWIEWALHGQDAGRELLSFVYGHTRGNALHIHQLLRAMAEEGAVWHTGDRWEWRPASELRLPAGIEPLLVRRLERLSGRAQLLMATAAVIGRSFDASLLAAVTGGGEAAAHQVITEGLAAGVLEHEERGSHRVRFVHELVAEVLRAHLPPRRHQRIHRDIAAALAAFGTADHGEIAAHYDRAGVQREAHVRALAAADRAERLYAFPTASEALQMAARNATNPEELAQARARMASLAERLGRFEEVEELCDLAIEWFAGQEEYERTVSLRLLRERARDQLGQPARRTLEALVQLHGEAAELGLRVERVSILIALSQAWARLGEPGDAERIAADSVRMAEQLGDARLLATALNRHGLAMEVGREEEARALLRRAIALFQQVGDSRGQAGAYNNLGLTYQREGDLARASEELRMAIAVARTAKMPDVWGTAALNLGVFRLKEGAYDEARTLLEQSLSLYTVVKNAELQLYALYNLAHVERAEGRHSEAAEMYEMAASLAQRIGSVDVELGAAAGAGLGYLAMDRMPQAEEALRRVAPRLVSRPDWFQGREIVEALAILVSLRQGDVARGIRQFQEALRLAGGSDTYFGAWLTAACADALAPHAPEEVERAVALYSSRVAAIGYAELTAKFRKLTAAERADMS